MAEVTNEMLLEELRKTDQALASLESTVAKTRVEMQRTLWEFEYGRQAIDRARRAYEEQAEARHHRYIEAASRS